MRDRTTRAAVPAALLLAAACTLAPRHQRPAAPVAGAFPVGSAGADPAAASSTAAARPAADLGWRDVFGDERLRAVVALALRNNRDLRIAGLNVELTQAQYRIQRGALLPAVTASGSVAAQRLAADQSSTRSPANVTVYTVGGTLSWELDFFGRLRSLSSAAVEQYLATEEARRSAHISIVAAVATQYLAERALDDQVTLARKTLETVESSLQVQRRTYEAGRTNELDLRTAESQVETARFNLSAALQQRDRAANALVLLVGQPLPADLPAPAPLDAQPLLAELPAGLPSEVLLRRPDVASAEHALRSANAQIGAARAAFFPSISLTAGLGTSSLELSSLFGHERSSSGFWSFIPRIDVPLFRGGALRASLDVAEVRKDLQVAQYERAIQVAFREVADALVSRAALDDQLQAQLRRVQAEQRRFELSDLRYRKGVDSYLVLLTAQRDLFAAQQQLIQSRLARLTNLVDLYRALGGGWQERTASAGEAPAGRPAQGS
jgi:multidrug efflux system outer membrane protein